MRNLVAATLLTCLAVAAQAAKTDDAAVIKAEKNTVAAEVSAKIAAAPGEHVAVLAAGEPIFDFPRISKGSARRPSKVHPLSLCGGCGCYQQCNVWEGCVGAPASNCAPFGFEEPCSCGPCTCW